MKPERTGVNPGFAARVVRKRPREYAGVLIRCPHCKRQLMETDAGTLKIKCPRCKKWVVLKKIDFFDGLCDTT